ncbi:DUF6491 family protein [Tsuneonella sp. CC-YZS046]|uniref:DUF6491 family protein n=1 Tax=Tsuneonella sp. CC-YZS046 TaxID=3042152 RepID=UPI002D78AA2F|nr:DUF6491 family protein [Tsuneonella sp. CC-YZS046]WRO67149.1 DUF6491 family protein [Tsuneonella sp. CC-YZS046]
MKLALVVAGCSFALAAGCAPTADEPREASIADGRECFWPGDVNGFNTVRDAESGSNRIMVSAGANRRFLFETFGPCPDLNFAENIGFDQHGSGQICRGVDVTLLVPGVTGTQRCPVRMIQRLTEDEAKALTARARK